MAPVARAFAESRDASPETKALLRAPRRALIIGNSRYSIGVLKNPANDARAMARELGDTGFQVTLATDLSREAMLAAISAYATELKRSKAMGLFYFAGHGAQLAWRNYLLPIDAKLDRIEDMQQRCVDLNAVIEGIAGAANPMNVVVLDACRDNPFGSGVRLEQKGLSQLDAPAGTFIAYATAPGNVASDGDGDNGLYTGHLLKELVVPEAKIEDVFKRVRLAVRRSSRGLQVPWESTSLEDDFWFIPPKELKKQSEQEAEEAFKREQAAWEKASGTDSPPKIEEYLKAYPTGRFAELAQLELDRALAKEGEKKVEVVAAPQNPYTKGSATADTKFRLGDSYTYQQIDPYSRVVESTRTETITAVTDREVIYDEGEFITDLLGNVRRQRDGRTFTDSQLVPVEYAVGKRWTTRYTGLHPRLGRFDAEVDLRIVAREKITVPAGMFDCYRIESEGFSSGSFGAARIRATVWMAPQSVRRPIARDLRFEPIGKKVRITRSELVAYKQS
ncbi:MAG: caspase family protein [Clostridia bacterium]